MKVAVIVVNYNDALNAQKYVEQIENYDIIDKIVIVDNKSTDISNIEILNNLKSDKVDVLEAPKNGGYSYGNNYGVKYLESLNIEFDYIIISNSDIEIDSKAIEKCLNILESSNRYAVIAPRMYNSFNKPIRRSCWKKRTFWLDVIHSTRILELLFYKILRNGEYSENDYQNELLEVYAISGAFFIIKYDIFKQIDYLDENVFLFYEEDILADKINNLGYKILSLNTEKFIHYESQTIGKTFSYYRKVKNLYKSKMYYHIKYNKINFMQKLLFMILRFFRIIELIIEIPLRKILKK